MTDDLVTSPHAVTTPTLSTIGAESLHEFIRYFAGSLIALTADIGSLWLLTSVAGIPYLISGAIAFCIGMVIIYILSVRWVFSQRNVRSSHVEFLLFALIGLIGLGLNELILWIATSFFGLFYLVSKIGSVIVVFSWNFTARKWLLFRTHA